MKQRPVGLCGVCGNYAFRTTEIGNACHAHHHGETCSGVIKDASQESAWEACPACTGKGFDQSVDCPQCAGAGWLAV
jgi:uncharacterized protein with PIN domain